MNKNELASAVAETAKISKGDAQAAVDAVFAVITGELKKGGDVRLVGFGNFSVSKRAASTGRNPQTGAEVKDSGAYGAEVLGRQGPQGRGQLIVV